MSIQSLYQGSPYDRNRSTPSPTSPRETGVSIEMRDQSSPLPTTASKTPQYVSLSSLIDQRPKSAFSRIFG